MEQLDETQKEDKLQQEELDGKQNKDEAQQEPTAADALVEPEKSNTSEEKAGSWRERGVADGRTGQWYAVAAQHFYQSIVL